MDGPRPNLNCLRNSYSSFVDMEETKRNGEQILVDFSFTTQLIFSQKLLQMDSWNLRIVQPE